MDIEKWKQKAMDNIKGIPVSDVFVLKELFNGVEWNTLSKGDKIIFGKFFKNEVINKKIIGVVYIGKASNNSAQYQRVDSVDNA